MKTFIESERICQNTFLNAGTFWFASSPGKETPILFTSEEDFTFVMNVIAQAAFLFHNMKILAFVVMNNHFHFVIQCECEGEIHEFFSAAKKRLQRLFPQIRLAKLDLRPISDLNSLRNTIVYTHRNGYVANPECTPFNYRWSTGRFYFNDIRAHKSLGDLNVRQKRIMFKGRDPQLPAEWGIVDDHLDPQAFCYVKFGMSMFRDAHHYFAVISKNVESYSGIAVEIDDGEFLTDQELFAQVLRIVREKYHLTSTKALSNAQRLDLARSLHYDYRSSNGQVRRVLGLSRYEVDSLFPLGK